MAEPAAPAQVLGTAPLLAVHRDAEALLDRKAYWLSALLFVSFFGGADETLQTTAAVNIGNEFDALDRVSWLGTGFYIGVITAYLLWTTVGEIWGRKVALVGILTVNLIGLVLAGFASSLMVVIVGRIFQGSGTGGECAIVTIVIADTFLDMNRRAYYEALRSGIYALACILGPIVGGWFSDSIGWRWIYLIQIPAFGIGLTTIILYFPNVRAHLTEEPAWDQLRRRNLLGMLAVSCATVSLYIGFDMGSNFSWSQPVAYTTVIVSMILLIVFGITEYFHPEPFIPHAVLSNRSLVMAMLINCFAFADQLSSLYYIPIFYEAVRSVSALRAGVLMLPGFVGSSLILVGAEIGFDRLGGYKQVLVVATILSTVAALAYAILVHVATFQIYGQSVALFVWMAAWTTVIWGSIMSINTQVGQDQDTSPAFRAIFLLRGSGTGFGICAYSAIVQSVLTSKIRDLDPPVSDELAHKLRQSLEYLYELSPGRQALVREFYGRAIAYALYFGVGLMAICIPGAILTAGKPLYTKVNNDDASSLEPTSPDRQEEDAQP